MMPYDDEAEEEIGKSGLPGFPKFTDEQARELIRYVTHRGNARKAVQARNMSEVDFIAGCMVFLRALGLWGYLPGSWIFLPMTGKDVFEPRLYGPTELDLAKTRIRWLEHRLAAYEEEFGDLETPEYVEPNADVYSRQRREDPFGLSEEDKKLLGKE